MRVTFLLPGYHAEPIGGYRVVYAYADHLAARGHRVVIVFLRRGRAPGWFEPLRARLWAARIRLTRRPLVAWHPLHPGVRLCLAGTARGEALPDADALVATAWSTAAAVLEQPPRKGAKFHLVQHHETWDGPAEAVEATWRLPLHRIVVSRWLLDVGRGLGATDLHHIPNGIDHARFRVLAPPDARPLHVASLYHPQPFKGTADALAVLARYHALYPDVPVTLFGLPPRGPDVPDWVRYVRDPDQDALVAEVYNRAAIFLGASLAEGFSLPPAEAMACGCAFVGTDSGGCRDYAVDGDTALLSPPGDRAALLANLVRATEDPALRAAIQARGTARVRELTWARACDALEAYFREAVPPGGPGGPARGNGWRPPSPW